MREPDKVGPYGRAWLLKRQEEASLAQTACLASWLVNRREAHLLWQWWLVSVVHLRDIPGVPSANKRYPEAEYEFLIYAINPEFCPDPVPDDPAGYPHLIPFDVIEQFHGITDQDVTRLCEGAVYAILAGQVSPDQDYRSIWKALIAETVRHFAEGRHPLN